MLGTPSSRQPLLTPLQHASWLQPCRRPSVMLARRLSLLASHAKQTRCSSFFCSQRRRAAIPARVTISCFRMEPRLTGCSAMQARAHTAGQSWAQSCHTNCRSAQLTSSSSTQSATPPMEAHRAPPLAGPSSPLATPGRSLSVRRTATATGRLTDRSWATRVALGRKAALLSTLLA